MGDDVSGRPRRLRLRVPGLLTFLSVVALLDAYVRLAEEPAGTNEVLATTATIGSVLVAVSLVLNYRQGGNPVAPPPSFRELNRASQRQVMRAITRDEPIPSEYREVITLTATRILQTRWVLSLWLAAFAVLLLPFLYVALP